MTSAMTTTSLGELRIEGAQYAGRDGQGNPDAFSYRPVGVYLQNDGRWSHWIEADGGPYQLVRDDTGWLVTCHYWAPGHTYRLATGGEFTDRLPLASGMFVLDPSRRYELRTAGETWELHELA